MLEENLAPLYVKKKIYRSLGKKVLAKPNHTNLPFPPSKVKWSAPKCYPPRGSAFSEIFYLQKSVSFAGPGFVFNAVSQMSGP